ncbi:hypothetical protein M1L60_46200 [Actinoplanes sp. TRM 88003]|uniref:Uncharacterized protein n=1 Tax=Paractinoplanes aksuensis TaxID=2939490 RepID=A0ABT1E775_9ACTN|nr:hypothetical protein [Actinoplanes aksuensis]MCO8277990.1 hypothetical protein [Actinoplanes aksuensis]
MDVWHAQSGRWATRRRTGHQRGRISAVGRRGGTVRDNLDQNVAFDKTIGIFFDWVAEHDDA